MGENSKIEWTRHTFNPWVGCAKVSAGCKNCYAETLMDQRYGRVKWGVNGTRSRTAPANWRKPLQWDKAAKAAGERHRVFCASLADVFEDRPDLVEWRTDLFKLIDATPNLDWLLLTKRPENIERMWREVNGRGWLDDPRQNVWLGTSVEDQEAADLRIPHLLKSAHLARFTFLSMEPLLGPVDLSKHWTPPPATMDEYWHDVDWVIVGGESGHGARPMHWQWARSLRDQCEAHGVPFLFKQWGEWAPVDKYQHALDDMPVIDGQRIALAKIGKHAAGRLLDGIEHNGFPG